MAQLISHEPAAGDMDLHLWTVSNGTYILNPITLDLKLDSLPPRLTSYLKATFDQTCLLVSEAIERQHEFVKKMGMQLWIRSPAAGGTMRRCVERYNNFLKLFWLYPGQMFVPTLDIDLAWHTHQCSATVYKNSMLKRAGRFINHDDKLGKGTLGNGWEYSQSIWKTRFAEDYLRCQCWDCEMLLDAVEEKLQEQSESLAAGKPMETLDMALLDQMAEEIQQQVQRSRELEIANRR
jgi:hypothetical protein